MSWFHCGHCAALFSSPPGDELERRCTFCGKDPSLTHGILTSRSATAIPQPMLNVKMASIERPVSRKKRDGGRSKSSYLPIKLSVFWVLMLLAVVLAARWLGEKEPPREESRWSEKALTGTMADEDVANLQAALPKCRETMLAFLLAVQPEVRAQFVLNPVLMAGKVSRFYQQYPFISLDPAEIQYAGSDLLKLSDGNAIEIRWRLPDGRQVDAVFREQDGDWRLDWEHFVRYSDSPWSMFLANAGESEEEFRLLARQRSSSTEEKTGKLSVAFYAPKFATPGDVGDPSPEFLIDQGSPDGQLLERAFKEAADVKGESPFGSRLNRLDPDGMIRVRVKIRRWMDGDTKKFEVTRVAACHWLSTDESGFSETGSR